MRVGVSGLKDRFTEADREVLTPGLAEVPRPCSTGLRDAENSSAAPTVALH